MIIKIVKSEKGTRSARGLIKYITQEEKGLTPDLNFTNLDHCNDVDQAIADFEQLQKFNTRVKGEKTLHLVVSFAPGESPDSETLKDIEHNIAVELGLGKNQRVSALHTDTDAHHLHIAINKIDPENYKSNNLSYSHSKLSKLGSILEKKHGLVRVARTKAEKDLIKEKLLMQWKNQNQTVFQKKQDIYDQSKLEVYKIRQKYDLQRRDARRLLSYASNDSMRKFYSRRFQQIYETQKEEYNRLFAENKRNISKLEREKVDFNTFLQLEALRGNSEAKQIYQGRSRLNDNAIKDENGNYSKSDYLFIESSRQTTPEHNYINKNGEKIYQFNEHVIALSKDTQTIFMPDLFDENSLKKGLEISKKHYGNNLQITGSSEFIDSAIKCLVNNPEFSDITLKDKWQQQQLELERSLYVNRVRTSPNSSIGKREELDRGRFDGRGHDSSDGSITISGWDPISEQRKRRIISRIRNDRRSRETVERARSIISSESDRSYKLERLGQLFRRRFTGSYDGQERVQGTQSIIKNQREGGRGGQFERTQAITGREQYLSDMPLFDVVYGRFESELFLSTNESDRVERRGSKDNGNNELRRDRHLVRTIPHPKPGLNLELVNYINERNSKRSTIADIKEHQPIITLDIQDELEFKILGTRKKGSLILLEREGDPKTYVMAVNEYIFNRSSRAVGSNIIISKEFKPRFKSNKKARR